jgi:PKD repeat protein
MYMGVYVDLPSKKTLAVIVVVVLICSGIVVAIIGGGMLGDKEEELRVIIIASSTSVMLGEPIIFGADVTSGSAQAWLWDLGDGNISINDTVNHTFERSDYYNVSVVVIGKDGQNVTKTIVVSVQNHDFEDETTGDLIAYPTRKASAYDLIYFELYSGITRANITARWSGTSATVEIAIFIMTNPTSLGPRLLSETVNVPVGDFEILRELTVPEDAVLDCDYIMVLQSNGGAIANYRLELTVEY